MVQKLTMIMVDLEPNWSWSKQKQVQEALFQLGGFGWNSVRSKEVLNKPIRMIFVWEDGFMTYNQSRMYHHKYDHKELSADELLNLTNL